MESRPTPGTIAGLIWIRDHLKKTTPPGCGLPVDAMLYIESIIKKGYVRGSDSNKESGVRRV